MPTRILIAAAIMLLTMFGYMVFPGHTYLQQDSQIYAAILEHLWDPGALAADPVAVHQHVTWSIYDEVLRAGRWITGLGFEPLMAADQILFRAAGLLGIYLIATALGLSWPLALLVAAVYSLGVYVNGPDVITVEWEPKPRASALPAVLLAVGLLAHRRSRLAGVAAGVAILYHPPTTYPFLLVYAVWVARSREWKPLIPVVLACGGLLVASLMQTGEPSALNLFATIDPELESLQRMRAAYSWVSTWTWELIGYHVLAFGMAAVAAIRLRRRTPCVLVYFLIGLPLVGILSIPATYLLLDCWKWALMPMFQPARALLFVVLFACILPIAAALRAVTARRYPEAGAWAAVAGLFFLYLPFPIQHPTPSIETPGLLALSEWARVNTAPDAVFHFADAGKSLQPGVFRVRGLRAVYVDWKGGGQVNMSRRFGEEWWRRWQAAKESRFMPGDEFAYGEMAIDYYILKGDTQPEQPDQPLFENAEFRVYSARQEIGDAAVVIEAEQSGTGAEGAWPQPDLRRFQNVAVEDGQGAPRRVLTGQLVDFRAARH